MSVGIIGRGLSDRGEKNHLVWWGSVFYTIFSILVRLRLNNGKFPSFQRSCVGTHTVSAGCGSLRFIRSVWCYLTHCMLDSCRYLCAVVLVLVIVVLMSGVSWGTIGGRDGAMSYFAQGQALAYEDDQARGRQAAVYNMQVQAVTQASGVFISPSRMGAGFEDMYRDILSRPEKYVQSYQIFSEMPLDGGLYKVTGMVSVSLDLLRGDFVRLGFLEEGASKRTLQDGEPAVDSRDSAAHQPAESPALPTELKYETSSDHPGDTQQNEKGSYKVLWGVTENWGEGFKPVMGGNDLGAHFLQGISQQLSASNWEVVFPNRDDLVVDESGELHADAFLEEAHGRGASRVVFGRVAVTRLSLGEMSIESRLRVLDVPSGGYLGEVHEVFSLEGVAMEEGAVRLAAVVVPQLGTFFQADRLQTGGAALEPVAMSNGGGGAIESGELELQVVSSNSFAHWLEVEKLLRQKAAGLVVKSLEIGQGETIIWLTGVTVEHIQEMDGSSIVDDLLLKVETVKPYERRVRVILTPVLSDAGADISEEAPKGKTEAETVQ